VNLLSVLLTAVFRSRGPEIKLPPGARAENYELLLRLHLEPGLGPEPKFGFAAPCNRSRKKYCVFGSATLLPVHGWRTGVLVQ
jgi:hypothetical protein